MISFTLMILLMISFSLMILFDEITFEFEGCLSKVDKQCDIASSNFSIVNGLCRTPNTDEQPSLHR